MARKKISRKRIDEIRRDAEDLPSVLLLRERYEYHRQKLLDEGKPAPPPFDEKDSVRELRGRYEYHRQALITEGKPAPPPLR